MVGEPRRRRARCDRRRPQHASAGPRSSIPSARPRAAGPAHRHGQLSASRARIAASTLGRRRGQPALKLRQQVRQRRLDRARLQSRASRPGRAARAGSPDSRTATLSPIPTTAQRSCGRPSTRIPATLRPSTRHIVGPFQPRPVADRLGDRDPDRERQQPRRLADHDRAQQRPAGRRTPGAALATAPGGLLGGGDERAVGRPHDRQGASPLVGRAGAGAGEAAADPSDSCRMMRSSSSTASPEPARRRSP